MQTSSKSPDYNLERTPILHWTLDGELLCRVNHIWITSPNLLTRMRYVWGTFYSRDDNQMFCQFISGRYLVAWASLPCGQQIPSAQKDCRQLGLPLWAVLATLCTDLMEWEICNLENGKHLILYDCTIKLWPRLAIVIWIMFFLPALLAPSTQ